MSMPGVTAAFLDGYVIVQHGAPSHTSKVTQQWCRTHMTDFCDKDIVATLQPGPEPNGLCDLVHPRDGCLRNAPQQHRQSEADPSDRLVQP